MLDLREELPLGDGSGQRVRVTGVEQSLEHHPPVVDVAVPGQVNPAEAAVREHPRTSYCPATSSPGSSLGVNENRAPQCLQNPSATPGRPSRDWPTSCPQFPQNRRFSGTFGSARTAATGSRARTGGTSTSPAPSMPREDLPPLPREDRMPRPLPAPPPLPVPADQYAGPEPLPDAVVAATGAAPDAGTCACPVAPVTTATTEPAP